MKRIAVLVLVVLLSGCAGNPEAPAEPEPEVLLGDRPDTTYSDVETGSSVGPDLNATTEAPPRLVPGEWWRIRYDAYLGEDLVEVVRVVAAVDEQGYVFGMPHEGWLKEAISFHAPAFGDVNFDLSYDTHNERFQPVRFPIVAGDSWQTQFAAGVFTAEVTQADRHTATIELTPEGPTDPVQQALADLGITPAGAPMTLTYDARQHEIVRMESALGTWEVVEHGYGFQGWVTVPRGEDTAIDYGVFGPASEEHTPAERTLTVDEGFNRMTMMHFVGNLDDRTPGHMEARDVTPDGEEWTTSLTGPGFLLTFHETNAPSGEWTVQDKVVGAGFTYHMGIAYFQYDIHLPDGQRRADHGHDVIR